MRAIRRDAQPRRKRERTRVASVLLAPGIAEARGQASVTYVGGAGDDPYLDSYREQLAEERERGDGRHRTPGVDEHGRTRSDRAAWASVLRGFALAMALLSAWMANPSASLAAAPATPSAIVAWDDPLVRPVVYLLEPTQDTAQNPLGIARGSQRNDLLGCWHSTTDNQGHVVAHGWTLPSSPAGGGKIRLPEYDQLTVGQAPYRVQAGCAGACGAGCFSPPYSGTLDWRITVP